MVSTLPRGDVDAHGIHVLTSDSNGKPWDYFLQFHGTSSGVNLMIRWSTEHRISPIPAGPDSPVNLYPLTLYREYMNLSYQNPAFVIVILWGIAIFTTTFLFMGSANLTSGIVIQGVCMIGSAAYMRKTGETCRTRKQEI